MADHDMGEACPHTARIYVEVIYDSKNKSRKGGTYDFGPTNGFEYFQLPKVRHTAYVRKNHCYGLSSMP